jgi:hypothetical protein
MSLISWPRRSDPGRVVYPEADIRPPFKLPSDLERDLAAALDEPFGAPQRTARTIEAELVHLRDELAHARELVKQGEAKEADLTAELTKAVDEEIAAKKATHDTEVAALESLRPSTGETA